MKRVIVTGGTGFVGANLTRRLLAEGHEVHLIVRKGRAMWRLSGVEDRVTLHETGLDDPAGLSAAVSGIRPDWIFHLAAYGAYSWQDDAPRIMATNAAGTVNLVEACLKGGFESFVNTGSSSEYGFKDKAPSETEWLDPNSCYAVSKAAATHYCRYISRSRDVNLTTLRLYSVYGPYEAPGRLIPALVLRGLAGELPPLVDPEVARDYVFVDDVCDAYLLAAGGPAPGRGSVYNVGTGRQVRLREAVDTARKTLGVTAEPVWGAMPNRSWDTSVWVADSGLIRRELGWRPRFDFESGFRRTAEWFSARPELAEFYRKEERALAVKKP